MDDQRIGRTLRALRHRLGWRQSDLARAAKCSQISVSRAERGHLPSLPLLKQMLQALDASLVVEIRWRAGALDRLLDEDHASLVAVVAELLAGFGWEVPVEVTYSEFGERGSIDILAFMPNSGVLLVIEVKTDLTATEATLRKIDEKVRLAPTVARDRLGWKVSSVGWLLAMPESSTLRRRVDRHAALLDRAFPTRGSRIRQWLHQPTKPIAGLWFLSPSRRATRIQATGGRERVRRPKRPSPKRPSAA
jgi:transcriptional regulator with XRE-family HTH domain